MKLLLTLLLVIGFTTIAVTKFRNVHPVSAAWFNDSWGYRKSIIITDSAAETNKYATLANYDASDTTRFQSDCGDIRFTDQNGKLLIYTLDTCDATTNFHINMPTMINGTVTIYIYYGNPNATNGFVAIDPYSACATCSTGTPATEEKSQGPVAYWQFDEGTGTSAYDATNSKNNGVISSATWQTEDLCISGKCLYFNGSSSITANGGTGPVTSLNTLSVSLWIRTSESRSSDIDYQQPGIIWKDTPGVGTNDWNLTVNGGKISWSHGDGSGSDLTLDSNTSVNDSKWHQITVTREASTGIKQIFIDGRLDISETSTTNDISNTADFIIGSTQVAINNTMIDEIKVYNYARTAAQVKADYNVKSAATAKGNAALLGAQTTDALNKGLVGYWKMDEATWSGTLAEVKDASGNSNNGQAAGATGGKAYPTSAKFGNGGYFDGVDDYVNVPSNSIYTFTSNFTISAWVYSSSMATLGDTDIVRRSNYWTLSTGSPSSGNIRLLDDSGHGARTSGTFSNNAWHHVVAVQAGSSNSTISIYVDGASQALTTTAGAWAPVSTGNLPVTIGGNSNGFFPGKIDDVRIYNRALSSAEVTQLYNFAPGPIAYYDFEESSGASVNDRSGNWNSTNWSGTGAQHWVTGKYGKAGKFNGTDDMIAVGDISSKLITNTTAPPSFSISSWFYRTSWGGGDLGGIKLSCSGSEGCGQPRLIFRASNQLIYFQMKSGSTTVSTSALNLNTWYHAEGVYNKDTNLMYLYLNGVLIGSATPADLNLAGGTTSLTIGNSQDYYEGLLDDVKVYNYARTPKQIVEDMNASHPSGGSPVGSYVAYWNLDEMNNTIAYDSSINTNNLNLSRANWTKQGKIGGAFDGGDDLRLSGSDDADLDFAAAEDLSISFWFKSDSAANPSANEYLVEKGGNIATDAIGYAIYTSASSDGLICFGIDDDALSFPEDSVCSSSDLYDGTWHHLMAKKTGTSRLDLYVDGKPNGAPDTSISATGTLENSAVFYVGDTNATNGTDEFLGDIDEVKVYRLALTDDEVKLEYNQGKSIVLGALSDTSGLTGGQVASNSASAAYCIPGDTTSCAAPIAEWNFEEGLGASALDSSGNGDTATWQTSVNHWAPGKIGKAAKFDGVNDFIWTGTNATHDFNASGAQTYELWFYANSIRGAGGGNQFLALQGPSKGYTIGISGDTSKITFYNPNGWGEKRADEIPVAGQWYHVAIVYNNQNITFYINGVSKSTSGTPGTFVTNTSANVAIGSNASAGLNGLIDQVKIFNYARTAAQVAWDYNRGKPVASYDFDECQGTTLYDNSGNKNNGTITEGGSGTNVGVGTCTGSAGTMWKDGATGKYNSSLEFDGTDDYVSVPYSSSFDITGDITLSAWIKRNITASDQYIISKSDGGDILFSLIISGTSTSLCSGLTNRFAFFATQPGYVSYCSNTTLTDTAWHHILISRIGSTMYFYLDGKPDGTANYETAFTSEFWGIYISYPNIDGGMSGQIDDAKIFNYGLTASQVKMEYNQGSAVRFGPITGTP